MKNVMEGPRKADVNPKVEEYFKQEDAQKDLAEKAMSNAKLESPVSLKEIKDPKIFAAIEFFQALPDTEGKWSKVFDSLKTDQLTPEAYEFLQKFVNGEAGPKVTYHMDEIKGGSFETPQMKEFREAKAEFSGKFDNKLAIWAGKGFVADKDSLVKAYMADKSLDLVTTADKKVAWGTPATGFDFKA